MVSYSVNNLFAVIARVPSVFADEFCWSVTIASTSAILLTSLSVVWMWLACGNRVARWFLLLVFAICCSLPGSLIGSSLLELSSSTSLSLVHWLFDRTIFAPVIANSLFCFPVSVLFAWFVMQNVPRDVEEHMATEGAGPWMRLYHNVFVAQWRMLLGSLVIIFAICFGELSASQLVVPPGMDTLPRRMLGLLHSGVNDHTAGLTIVSVSLVLVLFSIGYSFFNWNRNSMRE